MFSEQGHGSPGRFGPLRRLVDWCGTGLRGENGIEVGDVGVGLRDVYGSK